MEDGAISALQESAWPGNVREWENVVRKALVDAPKGVLGSVPAAVQEKMLETASTNYDAAFTTAQNSPVHDTDASKVRSGSIATLTALCEGGATDAIKQQAAQALLPGAPRSGVLVKEEGDDVWLGLYLDPADREDLSAILEETSHLLCIAWHASQAESA